MLEAIRQWCSITIKFILNIKSMNVMKVYVNKGSSAYGPIVTGSSTYLYIAKVMWRWLASHPFIEFVL